MLERRMHRVNELATRCCRSADRRRRLVGLILLEPDFGTAVSLLAVIGVMVFAAG